MISFRKGWQVGQEDTEAKATMLMLYSEAFSHIMRNLLTFTGWLGGWSELENKDHLSWAGLCWAWQKLMLKIKQFWQHFWLKIWYLEDNGYVQLLKSTDSMASLLTFFMCNSQKQISDLFPVLARTNTAGN